MDSARSVEASATVDGSTTMLAVAARDASAAWEEAGLSVGAAVKAEQTARQAMSMTERIIMARSGAKVGGKLIGTLLVSQGINCLPADRQTTDGRGGREVERGCGG